MINHFEISLTISTFSLLITIMTFITLGAYLLINIGIKRGEKEQGIFLLVGIGGKFLAYLILILLYWLATKNLSMEFIITFFILYLVFTIFLVSLLYKVLKTK